MEGPRINAIAATAPSVFPSGPRFIGVLVLDTRFPRLPGDIGNPASFGVPTLTRVVRGVRPHDAVQSAAAQHAAGLLEPFVDTLRALEREGAAGITTSCGFLVLMQSQLQAVTRVPVVTSSLMLLPELLERNQRVGVLTVSARHLEGDFFEAAGVPPARLRDLVVEGVDPSGEFAGVFLGDRAVLDYDRARRDVVEAALRLKARAPDVTDVVLECTNMPPYANAIEAATGLRPWSLLQSKRLFAPLAGRPGESHR
jgi:hypothetical protein